LKRDFIAPYLPGYLLFTPGPYSLSQACLSVSIRAILVFFGFLEHL